MYRSIARSTLMAALFTMTWLVSLTGRQVEAAPLASAQTLYLQAVQRVGHTSRFQLIETVVQPSKPTTSEGLRFVAPDRLVTAIELKVGTSRTVAVESIQVGGTKCQTPPRQWVCFRSLRPDVTRVVSSLLEPKLQTPHYVARRGQDGTTTIVITGARGSVSYAGALTIAAHGLPHTFRSTVHQGSRLVLTETGSFTYGGSYVIRLPNSGRR